MISLNAKQILNAKQKQQRWKKKKILNTLFSKKKRLLEKIALSKPFLKEKRIPFQKVIDPVSEEAEIYISKTLFKKKKKTPKNFEKFLNRRLQTLLDRQGRMFRLILRIGIGFCSYDTMPKWHISAVS